MDNNFDEKEMLLRAVLPGGIYWKDDGSLSSAAFKDSNGLSVDRVNNRSLSEAIGYIHNHFSQSTIVSVEVRDCNAVKAVVKYKPTKNIYHCEIHRSDTAVLLSKAQAKHLAAVAKRQLG